MTELLQTKELARRAGVTARTLHHYDRLGLLVPQARSASGYRLYSNGDLLRLQQILALRFVGFSLPQIKELLAAKELPFIEALELQRKLLVRRRRQVDDALKIVEQAQRVARQDGDFWQTLRAVTEATNMENEWDWVKKYYTQEQLDDLARRGPPEVLEKGQADWIELLARNRAA